MSTQNAQGRDAFIDAQDRVVAEAEANAVSRQHAKNKMTARERLAMFFDNGVWHEIGQFIGGSVRSGQIGSAVAAGYGRVQGRMVAAYAQDFSVRGGTLGKVEGDKIIDLIELGIRMRIPIVGIQDSGGARIQEGVVALAQYGRIFKKTCEASGLVPQISIILGPCAGGAVYQPALTDFIIMTRENSHMFVTGPDVVAATTGEKVTLEQLGGAAIHNFQSGVAHHMADTEQEAIDYVRSLLDYLPSSCGAEPPRYEYAPNAEDEAAAAAVADLVPTSGRVPYDVRDVVRALVDHGEYVEIQELFAPNVTIGFACVDGRSIGVVANQPMNDAGTLDVDASEKAARFVRFCDAFGLPVVTLVDVPGYRPGTEQEQAGIIRQRHRAHGDRDPAQGLRRRLHRHGLEVHRRGPGLRLARRPDRRHGRRGRRVHHAPPRARRREGGGRLRRGQGPPGRRLRGRNGQPRRLRALGPARRDHPPVRHAPGDHRLPAPAGVEGPERPPRQAPRQRAPVRPARHPSSRPRLKE